MSELLSSLVDELLKTRPTLRLLKNSRNLKEYIRPHITWAFQPDIFPHARTLLALMTAEIKACYGEASAIVAEQQLSKHFSVETGAHLSLPRVYDKAERRTDACDNINTLVFQSTLFSAAAHRAFGHPLNISFLTGRVPITNPGSSCAYFQPDPELLVRVHSNKWKSYPETYLPPLTLEHFETNLKAAVKGGALTDRGEKRISLMRECIAQHPRHFHRQISTAYSALYNEVYPQGVRQVTIDYEPAARDFLIALLSDADSLTYRLFANETHRSVFLRSFNDIGTGWKTGESPFDSLEVDPDGYPRFTRETYQGDLSPEIVRRALADNKIMPKTALLFFVFMIEAGLAPSGGMMQTRYATQIREFAVDFLKQHYPDDIRVPILPNMPSELAVLTPVWGLRREKPHQPVSYNDALGGWTMEGEVADKLLEVDGQTALNAGLLAMSDLVLEKGSVSADEKISLLGDLYDEGRILSV